MVHTWKIYDLKRTIDDGVVSEVIYALGILFITLYVVFRALRYFKLI